MKKNLEKLINRIDKLGRKITKLDLKYLIKSGSWQITNNFSNVLIGFLLSIAFANLLSDKDFGIYTYLISITRVLSFLTLSGLAVATTQAVARGYNTALITSKKLHQKWDFIYTIGLLAVASYYFFNNNYLFAGSLAIIAFTTPFMIAYQSYSNFLLGKKSFKKIAKLTAQIQLKLTQRTSIFYSTTAHVGVPTVPEVLPVIPDNWPA